MQTRKKIYISLHLPMSKTKQQYTCLAILQSGERQEDATKAQIEVGERLIESFWLRHAGTDTLYNTKGGDTDFAPRTEEQFKLVKYIQKQQANPITVSVGQIVSHSGLVSIYQFLRYNRQLVELPEISDAIQSWENSNAENRNSLEHPALQVVQSGIKTENLLCKETIKFFIEVYAAEAGNFALKTLPYGGIYLSGEITIKIIEGYQDMNRVDEFKKNFIHQFTNKGRMKALLEKIPVSIKGIDNGSNIKEETQLHS